MALSSTVTRGDARRGFYRLWHQGETRPVKLKAVLLAAKRASLDALNTRHGGSVALVVEKISSMNERIQYESLDAADVVCDCRRCTPADSGC